MEEILENQKPDKIPPTGNPLIQIRDMRKIYNPGEMRLGHWMELILQYVKENLLQ